MTVYNDPGPPAPSDFEFQNAIRAEAAQCGAALADAERRIEHLENALAATIRALALGQTTTPIWDDHLHQHPLAGTETTQHLARAAITLGLDIRQLNLPYVDTCSHGNDPVLCNECRNLLRNS